MDKETDRFPCRIGLVQHFWPLGAVSRAVNNSSAYGLGRIGVQRSTTLPLPRFPALSQLVAHAPYAAFSRELRLIKERKTGVVATDVA
jgi:hypothetical protein